MGDLAAERVLISLNRDGTYPAGGAIGSQVVMIDSTLAATISNTTVTYETEQSFGSYGSSSTYSSTLNVNKLPQGATIPGKTPWK